MKQDDPQFKLRLKPDLKQELENEAKANTRTLGAEIVARLETSLAKDSVWSEYSQAERLKTELALRAQIQYLVQRCAALGYGALIISNCLESGDSPDEATAKEIEHVKKDAAQAIEEANRALPGRLIEDLQAAMQRSDELQAKLGPGGYIPPLPEELEAQAAKVASTAKKPRKPAAKKA